MTAMERAGVLVTLGGLLLAGGCGTRDEAVEHSIATPMIEPSAATEGAGTLRPLDPGAVVVALEDFTCSADVDARLLVYRVKNRLGALRTYDDSHCWVAPPREMMHRLALEELERHLGPGVRIVDYPGEEAPRLRVSTYIRHFEEIRDRDLDEQDEGGKERHETGRAVVVLEFEVMVRQAPGEGDEGARRVAWVRYPPVRVQGEAPIEHRELFRGFDPNAYGEALATAAREALAGMARGLKRHLADPKTPVR